MLLRLPQRLRGRPWTAAALIGAAGVEIGWFPLHRPELLSLQGLGGTSSVLIAAALTCCALLLLVRPTRPHRHGAAACLLGLLSCPMADLGGFLVGMLLAVLGGAPAFAWRPLPPAPRTPAR